MRISEKNLKVKFPPRDTDFFEKRPVSGALVIIGMVLFLFAVFVVLLFILPVIIILICSIPAAMAPGGVWMSFDKLPAIQFFSVLLAVGVYLFFYGFRILRKKRFVENIPTSKIRSLAMGLVEINGMVSSCHDKDVPRAEELISPINSEKCVFYRSEIQEYHKSTGDDSHSTTGEWKRVYYNIGVVPFYVSDRTGRVLVDPMDSDVSVSRVFKCQGRLERIHPTHARFYEQVRRSLPRAFQAVLGKQFDGELRFTEECIPLGSQVYVMGFARDNPYVESSKVNVENIMLGREKTRKPKLLQPPLFYISDTCENVVLKRLVKRAVLFVILGPVISIVSLILALWLGLQA